VHAFIIDPAVEILSDEMDFRKDLSEEREKFKGEYDGAMALTDEWVLLFSGEVVGLSYGKNQFGRTIVLQCTDFSGVLDSVTMGVLAGDAGGSDLMIPDIAIFVGDSSQRISRTLGADPGTFLAGAMQWEPASLLKADCPAKSLLSGAVSLAEEFLGCTKLARHDLTAGGKPLVPFAGIN